MQQNLEDSVCHHKKVYYTTLVSVADLRCTHILEDYYRDSQRKPNQ